MNGHHQQYSIIISRERTRALKYPAHQNLATCWEELTFHQRCRDSFDHRTGDCQLRRHRISSPADWTCKTETLVYFYLLHLDETINTYLLGKYEAPTVLALHKNWKQGEIASLAPLKDPCHPSPLNLQWNKEDARCYVEFTLQTCSSDFPTQKKKPTRTEANHQRLLGAWSLRVNCSKMRSESSLEFPDALQIPKRISNRLNIWLCRGTRREATC